MISTIDEEQFPRMPFPDDFTQVQRHEKSNPYRKRRREVEDADGSYAETLNTQPEQTGHVEFKEFTVALSKLPEDQRDDKCPTQNDSI